jgi:hypothetical protein
LDTPRNFCENRRQLEIDRLAVGRFKAGEFWRGTVGRIRQAVFVKYKCFVNDGLVGTGTRQISGLPEVWRLRPVASTNFILPVTNGWHAEQISVLKLFLVLRVVNLLPQPQETVAPSYLGWMSVIHYNAAAKKQQGATLSRVSLPISAGNAMSVPLPPARVGKGSASVV